MLNNDSNASYDLKSWSEEAKKFTEFSNLSDIENGMRTEEDSDFSYDSPREWNAMEDYNISVKDKEWSIGVKSNDFDQSSNVENDSTHPLNLILKTNCNDRNFSCSEENVKRIIEYKSYDDFVSYSKKSNENVDFSSPIIDYSQQKSSNIKEKHNFCTKKSNSSQSDNCNSQKANCLQKNNLKLQKVNCLPQRDNFTLQKVNCPLKKSNYLPQKDNYLKKSLQNTKYQQKIYAFQTKQDEVLFTCTENADDIFVVESYDKDDSDFQDEFAEETGMDLHRSKTHTSLISLSDCQENSLRKDVEFEFPTKDCFVSLSAPNTLNKFQESNLLEDSFKKLEKNRVSSNSASDTQKRMPTQKKINPLKNTKGKSTKIPVPNSRQVKSSISRAGGVPLKKNSKQLKNVGKKDLLLKPKDLSKPKDILSKTKSTVQRKNESVTVVANLCLDEKSNCHFRKLRSEFDKNFDVEKQIEIGNSKEVQCCDFITKIDRETQFQDFLTNAKVDRETQFQECLLLNKTEEINEKNKFADKFPGESVELISELLNTSIARKFKN